MDDDEITIYKSLGNTAQDLATAHAVHSRASPIKGYGSALRTTARSIQVPQLSASPRPTEQGCENISASARLMTRSCSTWASSTHGAVARQAVT